MQQCVLVTGAAGWVGQKVCAQLQERGHCVIGVSRAVGEGPWNQGWCGDINAFAKPDHALSELLRRTTIVIHCAGHAHRPIETVEEIEAFKQVNVEGTRAVITACQKNGIDRLVYASTIAGYNWETAPQDGFSEEGALNPTSAYAATKLEGEQLVRDSGLDWRVVRLATVFGAGDRANFARLACHLKARRFFIPGAGTARKSVIPVGLAAELISRLALSEKSGHRLFNVSLSQAPTLREVCDAFSVSCGFRQARSLPFWLLRRGANLGDFIGKFNPGFPVTTANLKKLTTSTVVNNRRLREIFPDLEMPIFSEALRSSAGYYRDI